MTQNKIRVLVVDDSAFMRKVITDMLQSDEQITVIDCARDGLDAVEKVVSLKPDVVTLDVEMPKMNGLEALEKIMQDNPLPVVMLSSLTQHGSETTVKALTLGAVDFVAKPSGTISLDIAKVKEDLIQKVKVAAKVKVSVLRKPFKLSSIIKNELNETTARGPRIVPTKIVVIGSSTGGPGALQQVLTRLPADLPAPVLVVQHMPPGFTKSLANRFNEICKVGVCEAQEGDVISNGNVYIAPGGYHMVLKSRDKIGLNQDAPMHGVRPAVDVTLESVVSFYGSKIVGVILTGMGYDGAKGIAQVKGKQGKSIAQNEETCVVYGMPRAVVEMGKADRVLPIDEIAEAIVEMLKN